MENIKETLINLISHNRLLQTDAINKLRYYRKYPKFIIELTNYFDDVDIRLKQISSMLFKNFAIIEWNNLEFQFQKDYILKNIVKLYASAENIVELYLNQLIDFIIYKEEKCTWLLITEPCMIMLQDCTNYINTKNVLKILIILSENKNIYSESANVEFLFKPIITKLWYNFRKEDLEYEFVEIIMKIMKNLSFDYFLPEDLQYNIIIINILRIASNVINIEDARLDKCKKNCLYFFMKILDRFEGWVEYNPEKLNKCYIFDDINLISLLNIIIKQMKTAVKEKKFYDDSRKDFLIASTSYLTSRVISSKFGREQIKMNAISIIFDIILPQMIINSNEERQYIYEPNIFLKRECIYDRIKTTRNTALDLFDEIMYRFQDDQKLYETIFSRFYVIFDEYAANPSLENARIKYGTLLLVTSSFKFIAHNQNDFIVKYLLPDLESPYNFLCSQTFYFIRFFDNKHYPTTTTSFIFDKIFEHIQNKDVVLRTEALITVEFQIDSEYVYNRLKDNLSVLVQSYIELQDIIQNDELKKAFYRLIRKFKVNAGVYYLKLVSSLSKRVMAGITDNKNDKSFMSLLSSDMNEIKRILETKDAFIYDIFSLSAPMLNEIFTCNYIELYEAGLGLLSEFIDNFDTFDDMICRMFLIAIDVPKRFEFILDIKPFLKRCISKFISLNIEKVVLSILNIMDIKDTDESDKNGVYYIFLTKDECGCNIIDELLLNYSNKVSQMIPYFIDNIMTHLLEKNMKDPSIVLHLESLILCFICDFSQTCLTLSKRNKIIYFFDLLNNLYYRINRVFNVKLCLIFFSVLLKSNENLKLLLEINVKELIDTFIYNLQKLPQFIVNRQKLIKMLMLDENIYNSYYEEIYYDYFENLYEDAYETTMIDDLNVYLILNDAFNNLGSYGVYLFSRMGKKKRKFVKVTVKKYSRLN